MTVSTDLLDDDLGVDEQAQPADSYRTVRLVLLSIIAVAVLTIGVAAGFFWGDRSTVTSVAAPGTNSVDAGFARDMSTHHEQAVTMAGYVRDNTTNPSLKLLSTDIETSQGFQVGQMQGWLDSWHLQWQAPTAMAWMGHDMARPSSALMPGMATPAQMTRLESSHGTAMDILFLQLMIHHHQGGVMMAEYAREHAAEPYVVRLATAMYSLQSQEITQMEQLLRQLGGTPLPPPSMSMSR